MLKMLLLPPILDELNNNGQTGVNVNLSIISLLLVCYGSQILITYMQIVRHNM